MISRLVVVALASTRLIRALQHEQIGQPIRQRVDAWLAPTQTLDGEFDLESELRREWMRDLVTCDHCLGFWVTLAVALGWRHRLARPVIEALAAAMLLSAVVDHYPNFDHATDDSDDQERLT